MHVSVSQNITLSGLFVVKNQSTKRKQSQEFPIILLMLLKIHNNFHQGIMFLKACRFIYLYYVTDNSLFLIFTS